MLPELRAEKPVLHVHPGELEVMRGRGQGVVCDRGRPRHLVPDPLEPLVGRASFELSRLAHLLRQHGKSVADINRMFDGRLVEVEVRVDKITGKAAELIKDEQNPLQGGRDTLNDHLLNGAVCGFQGALPLLGYLSVRKDLSISDILC